MPGLVSIGKLFEPLFAAEWHSHSVWEICLFTAGEGVVRIDRGKIPFSPGTIICYPPAVPHAEQSAGGCLITYMLLDGFSAEDVRVPVFSDSPDHVFERLMGQLQQECQLKESGWAQMAQQLLQLLLSYLDRWRGSDHHPLISQLKHAIAQGACRADFSLSQAMESLPMSKDHLRRLFIRVTGTTPIEYLTALRIDEAKRLMRMLHISIKEVSTRAGFSDPAYFARVFRQYTGQSPRDFIHEATGGDLQLRHVKIYPAPVELPLSNTVVATGD